MQNKDSNASETFTRKEIQMACTFHCPKGIRGRRGRPGPTGKHGPPGPQGPQVLREIRGLLDLGAIRALKDPRVILVNPSQLLLL